MINKIITGEDINYTVNVGEVPTNIDDNSYVSGYINNFGIGNYNEMFKEYSNGIMSIFLIDRNEEFKRLKKSRLPPSLYNSLDDFYKYSLIEITKKIIMLIHNNKNTPTTIEKEIYDITKELVDKSNITIGQSKKDLVIYNIICKLIEELVKEQISVYIDNSVIHYYNKFYEKTILERDYKHPINMTIFNIKDITVNLEKTNIKLPLILIASSLDNFYSPIAKVKKIDNDVFILYPNDFSNMSKLKIKYGLNINKKCIKILLDNNASPFIYNKENNSAIYPIIKNYNYELVNLLKKEGIDFREFDHEQPIQFIKTENNNNINKILNDFTPNMKLSSLLSNIDGNLYSDIKTRIVSNEIYGNNVLLYLEESFNICSYITLQFLSEYLVNTNNEFTIIDATEIFGFLNGHININKNFLGENLSYFNIPKDFNILIAKQLLDENKTKLVEVNKNISELDDTIKKLHAQNTPSTTNLITNITSSTRFSISKVLCDDITILYTASLPYINSW